ncbi:MAG: rhodanese-like domain-containing protein [Brumimicrobium sp.]|nr:rhodanese-like domain-containing protein [Brumimicrobium sp.]
MKYISVQALHLALSEDPNFQLIDVRELYEYQICKLPSQHIPMAEIPSRVKEIDAAKSVCVMCKSGKRAAAVANLLETDYGFTDVWVVDGGIIAYAEQIDPNLEIYP